jgi:hypothetical protein
MRLKPPKVAPGSDLIPAFVGPRVAEGTYTVRLIKGDKTVEGEVRLVADPRSLHPPEDRALQQKTARDLYDRLRDMAYLSDVLTGLRDGARERAEALRAKEAKRLEAFADGLEAIRETMVATSTAQGIVQEKKLRERFGDLYYAVTGYDGRPSAAQLEWLEILSDRLVATEERIDAYLDRELPGIQALLRKRGAEPLSRLDREEWEAQEEAGGAGAGVPMDRLPWLLAAVLQAL